MSSGDHHDRFRPATIADDDWLIDGRPVVADGFDPGEWIGVDRYCCVRCAALLATGIETAVLDATTLPETTWESSGFARREVAPDAPPIWTGAGRLQACSRRVVCGRCGTEQVALAAGGEWEPRRWLLIAHGTVAVPATGRRATTAAAVAVLGLVILAVLWGNIAAGAAYWNAHLDARDGERIDAVILSVSETGSGARVVPSHDIRVMNPGSPALNATLEIDGATFIRYADAKTVPVYVRGDHATVVGDNEQRNDLLEMLAIDLVIALVIAGVVLVVRVSARHARRDIHA
jgi:hypothetical protein